MKILLAEDEPVTRRLIEQIASDSGHEVTAVGDGEAALATFMAERPPIVMLDWRMPKVDGLEVCRQVRATPDGRWAFILMLTGRDAPEDVVRAIDAGVDDYLIKPIPPGHLHARLLIAERRIAADAARRAAERELEDARWRAGVAETLAPMQHELNNPLAALLATLELATDERATPQEQLEALPQALRQTRRMVDIMRRISQLRQHRSIDYVAGVKMLDMSEE